MNDWKGKNVLVTGAAGFIGGCVARELLDQEAIVTCLIRTKGKNPNLLGAKIFEGDVADYALMCEIISSGEIEYVFHLAANAIVRVGARDPMNTYRINVMGTVALLEAVRTVGRCKKVVVASSDKAYGDHDILPYKEDMALQPKNTYDTSKACADMIARSYAHNYDLPIVVTRCSNVYGPRDPNMSRIIPNTINRILEGKKPQLYSDVSVMEREFIFIDDVVVANLALALSGPETNGEAFNVGRNHAHMVSTVVEQISKMMGFEDGVEIVPREPSFKEIQKQYISARKLEEATEWSARVQLIDGLRKTIDWYKVFGRSDR